MSTIFISYRQSDTMAICDTIYPHMIRAFGADSVFRDKIMLLPGQQYESVIMEHIANAAVFLELIGPTWLDCRDNAGNRRLGFA